MPDEIHSQYYLIGQVIMPSCWLNLVFGEAWREGRFDGGMILSGIGLRNFLCVRYR